MKIDNEIKLDFDDVLLMPQRSTLHSRNEINLTREFKFYHSPREWIGVPIMCANMSFCSFEMADALAKHKMISCLHKYHTEEQIANYFKKKPENIDYVFVSIGYKRSDIKYLKEIRSKINQQPNICIDVPNGHMDAFVKYCAEVRKEFPESIILAGNVTSPSSAQELIIHGGVDIVKVGIGGGSACTTRFLTGCGVPQLSTCIENSHIAHGLQKEPRRIGLICSDGGHKNPGDVAKAFCAGSDFVMLGGMFAGTDECAGEWEYEYQSEHGAWQNIPSINPSLFSRKKTFTYYGMSTHHSQLTFEETQKDYRASEGTKITIDAKGPVHNIVKELLGGIRSCCCYIGADSMKNMSKCAHFCRVNQIHQNKNPKLGV